MPMMHKDWDEICESNQFYRDPGPVQWIINCHVADGNQAFQDGCHAKALKEWEGGITMAEMIGDTASQGLCHNGIGLIHTLHGNYPEALEHFQKSLAIKRKLGDLAGQANTLGNLGVVYSRMGQTQEALDFLQQALAIDRQIDNRRGEAEDLGNMGICYDDEGKTAQAISCYQQALAIHRELRAYPALGKTLLGIGQTWLAVGDVAQASAIWQEALGWVEETSLWLLLNGFSRLARKGGNLDVAIFYGKLAVYSLQAQQMKDQQLEGTMPQPLFPEQLQIFTDLADLLTSRGRTAEAQLIQAISQDAATDAENLFTPAERSWQALWASHFSRLREMGQEMARSAETLPGRETPSGLQESFDQARLALARFQQQLL